MTQPLVSVVMPVYNGAAYIKKAVDSVYAQDVSLELLVIDDCSTDNTMLDDYPCTQSVSGTTPKPRTSAPHYFRRSAVKSALTIQGPSDPTHTL